MPQNMPVAEQVPDAARVRALLHGQFPDLAQRPLTVLAHGWDNIVWRLGDDLLVRLPRRAAAAQLIVQEQRWLPLLAPHLPLPVPVPLHTGRPGPTYPWPWSVTAYLPGTDAGQEPPLDTAHAARTIAGFLAALHRPAPPDAPSNPFRGVAVHRRDARFRENVGLAGDAIDAAAALVVWEAALAADPWQHPPVWVHGDLHPANLLVGDARLVGVVDFGDLTAGDPATDLAVAWTLLPRPDRPAFWRAYAAEAGHVDDALYRRSRGWAIALAAVFLAHSADNPAMGRIGRRTATAVLEPDLTW